MIHCYRLTYQTVYQQVIMLVLLTHDHHCLFSLAMAILEHTMRLNTILIAELVL